MRNCRAGARKQLQPARPRKPRQTPAMAPRKATWNCRAGCPPRPCRPTSAPPPPRSPPPTAASSAMRPASWSGPWADSLVQLMWIELVNQGRLAAALADPSSTEAILYDTDSLTDRSLELLGAKCRDGRADVKDPHGRRGHNRLAARRPPPLWRRQLATRRVCDAGPAPCARKRLDSDALPPSVDQTDRLPAQVAAKIPPVGVRNWPKRNLLTNSITRQFA